MTTVNKIAEKKQHSTATGSVSTKYAKPVNELVAIFENAIRISPNMISDDNEHVWFIDVQKGTASRIGDDTLIVVKGYNADKLMDECPSTKPYANNGFDLGSIPTPEADKVKASKEKLELKLELENLDRMIEGLPKDSGLRVTMEGYRKTVAPKSEKEMIDKLLKLIPEDSPLSKLVDNYKTKTIGKTLREYVGAKVTKTEEVAEPLVECLTVNREDMVDKSSRAYYTKQMN